MPITTMVVTGKWTSPNNADLAETGYVEFTPNSVRFVNGGVICDGKTVRANLDSTGAITITLVRCATGYTATEYIASGGTGATVPSGALNRTCQVPDGAGPVDLKDCT